MSGEFEVAQELQSMEQFQASPTPRNFERVINDLWFSRGEIDRPFEFLMEHAAPTVDVSASFPVLLDRIRAYHRLKHYGVQVPDRSEGTAYIPEPRRVMYCVHQTPAFNSNGYSTRTRGVAVGLMKDGWDPIVVGRSGYPWDFSTDKKKPREQRYVENVDGVSYIHITGGNLNRDRLDHYIMVCADAFVREAKNVRPSVIQSASNFQTALPALIAARRLGVPFVYEVRGLWELTEAFKVNGFEDSERFNLMRKLETLVAREADRVLAITAEVKDELVRRGISPDKIDLVPNAVVLDKFMPLARNVSLANRLGIVPGVPTIGFAGSIVAYEGLDVLVKASAALSQKGVKHQVVIAGSGAALAELKTQAIAAKAVAVKFVGQVQQDLIPSLLSLFDVVVCPRHSSKVTELVSPLKPLEAFATATPCILSDVAPHRTLAGENESRALLVEPGNPVELAAAIERLIYNTDLRVAMGRRGRLWVRTERNWPNIALTMLSAYDQASVTNLELARECRTLSDVRVGIISDEFTFATLDSAMTVEKLSRETWKDQLDRDNLDMVFLESAWNGNDGEWHRGVGYYSPEEANDITSLITHARKKGIPVVFWNKEDPVHFARFSRIAGMCDYVFTTDANKIPDYLNVFRNSIKVAAATPFYASPVLHNPLKKDWELSGNFAFAGTYYGERYASRSAGLLKILEAAKPHGLSIFDRQADNPDSPYRFPKEYQPYVVGGIPYAETVESYKTFMAHLNVNSVQDSPTMFSRRVVEIPACGGIVVSSWARGVTESLGQTLACTNDPGIYSAWFYDWETSPESRLREAWLQMRSIYRSHTSETELVAMCRTVGLAVKGITLPRVLMRLDHVTPETAHLITQQSVQPVAVVSEDFSGSEAILHDAGIATSTSGEIAEDVDVLISVHDITRINRTFVEDVTLPLRFSTPSLVSVKGATDNDGYLPVIGYADGTDRHLIATVETPGHDANLDVNLPMGEDLAPIDSVHTEAAVKTVLIAGHDLKFAKALMDGIEAKGHRLLVDQWLGHDKHDVQQSRELLSQADIVLCEWGLGNAVWYSNNLLPHQKLIVRVHLQELSLPYLAKVKKSAVDTYVFVGEQTRSSSISLGQVPADKSIVIPNFVDVEDLDRPKTGDARFAIGIVGVVPERKRLDLAVELIEILHKTDDRYYLRIKGKLPQDYPWMAQRPEEMAYYERVFAKIDKINEKTPGAIVFDGFGSDMASWYSEIGTVISTSDFESFHLTIADGAASGSRALSLAWDGADQIYPAHWLVADVEEMAEAILEGPADIESDIEFARQNFDKNRVMGMFDKALGI